MERINVRVDQRLKQELEAEAKEKGVKPSDIVRQVLQRFTLGLRTHSGA